MSTNLEEVKMHYEQLCWLIERTDTVEQLILLKEVCAGFQFKEEKEDYEECDCGEKLLICDSGMKLCSVGCKDKYVYTKKEDEEEKQLKCLGFRPQTRIGECEGCKAVCEECENLMIVEDEEEMKSIDWVKRNETMIDFMVDRSNEPDTEPESDTDEEEEEEEQKCEKCNKKYKLMYNDILCAGCRCAKKD